MTPLSLDDVLAWRTDAEGLTRARWLRLPREQREPLELELWQALRADMQANQLVYYRPVNADAPRLHASTARLCAISGGNKSGKTGEMLIEAAILMTGVIPDSLRGVYPESKLIHGPARVRLEVTTINAWDVNLKHKLQWFHWNGRMNKHRLAGDPRLGHWGWIPQRFLIRGDWDQSWNAKTKVLTLQHPETNEPWSTMQVMTHEQEVKEHNQGAFHLVVEDEIPPEDRHRANLIRAMEYDGRVLTGGTPPDDRSAAIGATWFFDELMAPGLEGSNPDKVAAFVFWMEHNRTMPSTAIAAFSEGLTVEQRAARMHGEAIHLSGVVIRGFTEKPRRWCFDCDDLVPVGSGDLCATCGRGDLVEYRHVWDDDDLTWPGPAEWPTLFYMDPHQSKPTACAWFRIDPNDGWWQIHELEIAGNAAQVKREVEAFEAAHHLDVAWRKGDPKATAQGNQFAQEFEGRIFTIREAFEEVGFSFEEANTNFSVAIGRIEQALQPNRYTRVPTLRIHRSCTKTIYQVTHFQFEQGRSRGGGPSETKELPARRHSDFPALLRYLAMDEPEYRFLKAVEHRGTVSLVKGTSGRNLRTGW